MLETGNSTLIKQFCGGQSPLPIVSQGNIIIIQLQTSGEGSWFFRSREPFFKVTYSSASSYCGGELLSTRGEFATPNYPRSYPPKSECIWAINLSPGNKILF